jgi:predicted nuclease of predicted toxin-antitoxin system
MKLLVDVNLTPKWIDAFEKEDVEALHWSNAGPLDASDRQILEYALENNVFTHDLDFGSILAGTSAKAPSVIQIRTENTTPDFLLDLLIRALNQYKSQLNEGALITIDPGKMRARILPIERNTDLK